MFPLTVAEAAKRLRISRALCYALISSRRIRHERHGLGRGRILIQEQAIEEYRQSRTIDPKDEQPKREPPKKKPALRHLNLD